MSDNTRDFNESAKGPYQFVLYKEVENFYARHPERLGNAFIVEVTAGNPVVRATQGQDGRFIAQLLMSNPDFEKIYTQAHKEGSLTQFYYNGTLNLTYGVSFMNEKRDNAGLNLLGQSVSPELRSVFTFDHETGHLLTTDPHDTAASLPLIESTADAYAVIRHYQRFGRDSAALDRLLDIRATTFVFGDTEHPTMTVIEKLIADKDKIDFDALTPRQTVELARRYARDNQMPPAAHAEAAAEFADFKHGTGKWNALMRGDYSLVDELAKKVLLSASPAAFKVGARALRALLDGEVGGAKPFIQPAGEYFDKIRKSLDLREAALTPKAPAPKRGPRRFDI